ncbi:MAG TPA: penicillin acylase family protein [Actinomycetota bacterium]|nr:penicillin acylase family protein [Actinomycetota bacterium]
MDLSRSLFGSLLGRRLPATAGRLEVPGISERLTIRRDRWGIPHVDAGNELDAWYGLGFCHGQDRSFQLETLVRVIRGTLAALVGKDGVAMDRLSRRIGFSRNNEQQLRRFDADLQTNIAAYVAGVNAGATIGLPRRAHEFFLLRSRPTPWAPADVVGMIKLQSFLFATNADAELARLKILQTDGPEVMAAVDPSYGESWQGVLRRDAEAPAVDRLAEDLAAFAAHVGAGGASNSWGLSGSRTASGRPILANDPHLPALLPSVWYLAHLTTPEWAVAGATLVGGPAVEVGHNGFAAWGITAALFDNTDLFQEQLGPDGRSVRSGDGFVPCEVFEEKIQVRYKRPITEQVVVTPRGPVVSPALDQGVGALSISAFWLKDLPVEGFLRVHRTSGFEQFRRWFARWPAPDLNVSYADASGTIGWQLVGAVPRRRKGWGTVPLAGWEPGVGWEEDPVPFEDMPYRVDPEKGFLATANTRPHPNVENPFLGVDWIDGYRLARITEVLAGRSDWDPDGCSALQLDELSLPWRDMREVVLSAPESSAAARTALSLLADWDGRVSAAAPAAALFELFVAEMARRVAIAKAPGSAEWVLGRGFAQLLPYTSFSYRRVGHLVQLLNDPPEDWFGHSWGEEIARALEATVDQLTRMKGEDPAQWAWGQVRPVELKHPVGEQKPLDKVFNIGPFPWGGDSNTVAQTSVDPLNATNDPGFIASLRMVADVGNWDECRWVIPSGQSGNPMSPNYADQLPLWQKGEGVPIPWTPQAVAAATVATLELVPGSE